MEWILAIVALIAVAVGAFLFGRRGSGEPAGKLDQILNFQAELSGRVQQSESSLNERLEALSKRVGEGLTQHTEKTGVHLKGLHERLAVIDSAQKSISDLGKEMVGLQDILSNKQLRGNFGEFQMESLIKDALPPSAYEFQSTLSNGTRIDCLIRLPSPPGIIPIDSKFPLEAYRAIQRAENETDKKNANRDFSKDVNTHVKHIAERYIIANETDWAIMFLPSEAIFAELNSHFPNIVEDAQRRRVGFASPSTLMALVNTVGSILKDGRMKEQAGLIQKQVELMLNDVRLLDERVGKLKTHFRQAGEDIDGISTSSSKIADRGQKITDVQLDDGDTPDDLLVDRPHLKEVEGGS
ncbi:MAG: DNA recombination protein RmuC [Alphaproteobacteria bacterium]|nr:DNA recombination protein RmuC [Alphaproteobacteria bacterium]